jgi:hypothetical protein
LIEAIAMMTVIIVLGENRTERGSAGSTCNEGAV